MPTVQAQPAASRAHCFDPHGPDVRAQKNAFGCASMLSMSERCQDLSTRLELAVRQGREFTVDKALDASARTISSSVLADLVWNLDARQQARGLRLSGLVIEGDLNLEYLDWRGPFELKGCHVRGDVRLSYARIQGRLLMSESTVQMVAMRYTFVEGGVHCRELIAHGGLFALGCRITGGLTLQRAELHAPREDERKNRAALDVYRAEIGDVYASRAKFFGGVYGIGIRVSRNVRLAGAEVWSRSTLGWVQGPDAGDGLDLAAAEIGGSLYLWTAEAGPLVMHGGSIRLRNSSCRSLRVTRAQLRADTHMEGLTYATTGPVTEVELLEALDQQLPAPRKAYAQLARFAESTGASAVQRKAMIHQQRRISVGSRWWSPGRVRHTLFGWFAGYGYAPGRAVAWLVGCVLLAAALALAMGESIREVDGGAAMSVWTQAIAFTIDQVAPLTSSGYADQWSVAPSGTVAWLSFYAFVLLKFAAWALAALALVAVTGLARAK